uniref:Transforming acidic coiled-coil-containing protein 1 isoform X2 n=1 Tax=Geotrypetes seraphini TaxID=260995 RepID=A0A6P8R3L7_GEOSA|nr:transforming acidic coiled-coil-containing protein 1 isoform X2 [Geotrypetes seraphini]
MAFSPWQILSPVQWAKWTWSAVRGGSGDAEDAGVKEDGEEDDSQAEEKSLSFSSDSEGNFETPEADTPVQPTDKELCDLSTSKAKTQELNENEEPLVAEVSQKDLLEAYPSPQQDGIINSSDHCELENGPEVGRNPSLIASALDTDPPRDFAANSQKSVGASAEELVLTSDVPACAREGTMAEETMVISSEGLSNVESKEEPLSLELVPMKDKTKKLILPFPEKMLVNIAGEPTAEDIPLAKGSYNFDPEAFNEDINPFKMGGSKLQNSPTAVNTFASPSLEISDSGAELPREAKGASVKMEFGFTDGTENTEVKKSMPKKLPRQPVSKLASRRQKDRTRKTSSTEYVEKTPPAACTATDLANVPLSKALYNSDPSQYDNPNFNPFDGSSMMENSPTLPKGSYSFDPDKFDDLSDPFKPAKSLPNTAAESCLINSDTPELGKLEAPQIDDKVKASPKKTQSRLITSGCKVKKQEALSLTLDPCAQDTGISISEIPELENRDGHATDEEKLASTTGSQKPAVPEVKGCEKETLKETEEKEGLINPLADTCCSKPEGPPVSGGESPLAGVRFSELDKLAVLTLIREEIISKETEVEGWKQKYEGSHHEVLEMRKIVAEYEKTIAQMIEDEQRSSVLSQKSLQQLTMEKDQAVADLNSVERSLSDLFRRYENLKGVLEGFKKNEEALKKCAEDYLNRVKQEEQRYQALKIHAEEKLNRANEEIAQVRAKANAESAALHASLRKEQMKVESFERALQQKNQEIEELTKICDELIAKIGKSD